MTVPFEPEDADRIAQWLGRDTAPEVRAVRVACDTEDEWLAARVKGVGASEIAAIVGKSTFVSPYALWYRKKLDWRLPRTEAMRWGHLVEDPIAELFAEQMPLMRVVKPLGAPYSLWSDPVNPWMICTPDRLAVDQVGNVSPVEVKSDEGGTGWGETGSADVPMHHHMQLMWQAHIFGAAGGYVVRKKGSGKNALRWYWVTYSPDEMRWLIPAAGSFLESIELDRPPEPDGSKTTTETLKELNPAIDAGEVVNVPAVVRAEWQQARAAKRDAIERESLASNAMRAAMGRAEFVAVDGRVFAKRRIGKRAGYSVEPGQTDELRSVGDGQQETHGSLWAAADSGPAPADGQEGSSAGDPAGAGLVDPVERGTGGESPESVAGQPDPVMYPDDPEWRTSSHSSGGACVEVRIRHSDAHIDNVFGRHHRDYQNEHDSMIRRRMGGLRNTDGVANPPIVGHAEHDWNASRD